MGQGLSRTLMSSLLNSAQRKRDTHKTWDKRHVPRRPASRSKHLLRVIVMMRYAGYNEGLGDASSPSHRSATRGHIPGRRRRRLGCRCGCARHGSRRMLRLGDWRAGVPVARLCLNGSGDNGNVSDWNGTHWGRHRELRLRLLHEHLVYRRVERLVVGLWLLLCLRLYGGEVRGGEGVVGILHVLWRSHLGYQTRGKLRELRQDLAPDIGVEVGVGQGYGVLRVGIDELGEVLECGALRYAWRGQSRFRGAIFHSLVKLWHVKHWRQLIGGRVERWLLPHGNEVLIERVDVQLELNRWRVCGTHLRTLSREVKDSAGAQRINVELIVLRKRKKWIERREREVYIRHILLKTARQAPLLQRGRPVDSPEAAKDPAMACSSRSGSPEEA